MFRFIHSADWQLGARFRQFGKKADALRTARLSTLRRSLDLARAKSVDAFLIAGDLFEDNQVSETLVAETLALFAEYSTVEFYILPGNHDPISGPEAVWNRESFHKASKNVHVLTACGITDLGQATLLASPLRQKISSQDPSAPLEGLAATIPPDKIKIGLTHGAIAIEGKHQPNDFPIALNAASRAGLDYLAIGHWHNWLADTDGGRIIMPGTPEPDQFDQPRSGQVAFVEIAAPGAPPKIEPVQVATFTWITLSFDFDSQESAKSSLQLSLGELQQTAEKTILRINLTGTASPTSVTAIRDWITSTTKDFFECQIVDKTRVELDPAEIHDLQSRHPILAQVLSDINQLEMIATGTSRPNDLAQDIAPLTLTDAQSLMSRSKIDIAKLDPAFFAHLRQLTLNTLQEVSK